MTGGELPDLRGDHEGLADGGDLAQVGQAHTGVGGQGGQLLQRDVGQVHPGDAPFGEESGERVQIFAQFLGDQHEGAADAQGAEDLHHGHVERQRHVLERPPGRSGRRATVLGPHEVGDGPVGDDHPLGQAGGARGVHDVDLVVGCLHAAEAGGGGRGDLLGVPVQHEQRFPRGEFLGQ